MDEQKFIFSNGKSAKFRSLISSCLNFMVYLILRHLLRQAAIKKFSPENIGASLFSCVTFLSQSFSYPVKVSHDYHDKFRGLFSCTLSIYCSSSVKLLQLLVLCCC